MNIQRKPLRLSGYNYRTLGFYFITICTYNGNHLFGRIKNNKMNMNEKGMMVNRWWCKLSDKFHAVTLDKYVIMPNHFHGIINLVGADPCVCPFKYDKHNTISNKGEHMGSPLQSSDVSIPKIIQWFKTMTTIEYIRNIKQNNGSSYHRKIWQRSYFDHIIRDKKELYAIRKYIVNNPVNWDS